MIDSGKTLKILLGAASALAIVSAARAADVVVETPVTPGFNWSGFYIGVGGGFGANVSKLSSDFAPGVSFDGIGGEGAFGELTVGYDHMISPRFLVGAFAAGHYGNIETSLDAFGFGASIEEKYGFDGGLRAGYLFTPTTLGYISGGYSWQKSELDFEGEGFDWDKDGYFVGVGMETAVSGNITLKGEYRFTQFSTGNVLDEFDIPDGVLNTDSSRHTFHIGANYRFNAQNGEGAAFEAPAYSWTGFSVGLAAGAGAVVHELEIPVAGDASFNGIGGEGIFGEASIGYDHDFGNWVGGVQVGASYSGLSTELEIGPFGDASVDAEYGFDVLARVGYKATETTLAYVIGGYSYQHFNVEASAIGDIVDWDANGFSVGGGLETAVTDKMTVGIEYRYSQFEGEDFGFDGLVDLKPSFHTVRIGAKYKFN